MNKLRKGDKVIVLSGKDKGKTGSILSREDDSFVIVGGINMITKSQKPNPMKGEAGGFKTKEAPIHQCKLAIYNEQTKKQDRVGVKVREDGSRYRVFKSNGEEVKVA